MVKTYCKFFYAYILFFHFFYNDLFSQVVINEICPANITTILNSNGKYDDWIELHNSGPTTINLAGYGLSDDSTKLYRFQFPSYNLAAGNKVLVFTSDSTSELIVNHWEMAVDGGTSWKYASGSASLDPNWRNPGFNSSSWSSGNGGIGFGDGDDGKTIPTTVSVMMIKTFNIPDTSKILKAILMMDYDDGFVAYLNGVEIARANIGTAGTIPIWNDLANSSHEAQMYQGLRPDSFFISPTLFKSLLRPTNNVLAVETHNTPANSDDMSSKPYLFFGMGSTGTTFSATPSWFHAPVKDYYNAHFKLSRSGETIYFTNPSGTIIDQKAYPAMDADNSLCRKPDGASTWCFVSVPTPEATNNSSTCYLGYAYAPVFSKPDGYYATSQTVSLSTSTPGGIIRYTTNGNTPTTSSPQYSSPISISSSKTIRARVFASGYLPSPVVTNTYAINQNTHLSSFSITTDSLNLWDYNTGIYVLGPGASTTSPYKGANFWQDWEKPASIEYFDKSKNLVVKFDAVIKIYGNYSRAKPQKSFEIKLSDKYGTGSFNYSIYPDKPYVDKIDNIVLRNSGTDWNNLQFRDAMEERILKNTYTGYLAAEPVVAYLNGAYWGVYQLNENHDHHWMKNNFGLGKSEIDYLKESGSSIQIQEGSDATFWTLYNYATSQSPTTQAYYNFVNNLLDLKNYTDYFAMETYYNNGDWIGDWTNNIQMWRPNTPGSKWRYFVYDLDFGLGLNGTVNDNRLAIARNPASFSLSSEMFDALLNNPTYKKYFINRYADLINTIFLPSNVDAVMKSFRDTMSYDMTAHFAKWGSNTSTWQSNITSMMNFANARPDIMRDFIKSGFGLASKVTLTLATSPAGSGRIEISTITPTSYPWSGVYFNGNPVTITAIPNPGYTFDHFHSNVAITTNNTNQSVTYNFTANDVITAYFTGSPSPAKICVSELNYNADSAYNSGDWIELHNYGTTSINLSGWKLSDGNDYHNFVIPTGTVIPANGYLVLTEDSVKFKSQFPTITNRIGPIGFNFSNGGDQVRLFDNNNSLYLSFFYQDVSPWPYLADGYGYTCELTSNLANPNDGSSWFAGCIGGSPGRAYTPLLSVPVSITGNTTFCSGGSAQLKATSVQGYTYQWKKNNVDIAGATDSIYSATQSGTYSVTVYYQGCSIQSQGATITVVSQQPVPQTTPASRCGPGEIDLVATSSDSVFWYDAITGGNLIVIGDTLSIPLLNQTTTYYARTGRNCQSNSVSTVATIVSPDLPPVSTDVTRCGPGTATISATAAGTIRWFNAPTGGALLQTGASFTTNILDHDTSYFVESGSSCPSPRIEVHVIVNSTPSVTVSDASRCGSGSLVLTANSSAPVSWFSSQYSGTALATGNSFTTPNLAATDTFYAEANSGCPSPRSMSIAIVNPYPSDPVSSDVLICNSGSVTLNATATEQVNWYDAMVGGNLLYIGSDFITPVLSSSATYYVSSGYTCQSNRVPVNVIVGTAPPPPSATNASRCGTGTVTLSATSPELIYWFNAPAGGTLLATSDFYITPSIATTTTYYAEAGNNCRSSRTPVQAVINPLPSPPSASNVTRCGNGAVTLNATASLPISWYDVPTGGSSLATGPSYTIPNVSSTTTYYVEDGSTNCTSNRISVQAVISQQPPAPVANDVSRCGSGTVSLSATSSATVSWFSAPSGGSALSTGLAFTTPSLTTTTTYYVEAYNGCSSNRSPVQAVINSIPSPPVTSNGNRCGTGSVSLTATSPEQIYWYTSSSGGSPVYTGSVYSTPSLSSTTTYYVEAGDICRSSRIATQAVINSIPSAPNLTGGTNCGTGSVILFASSSSQVSWFDVAAGGNSLASGSSFSTPVISSTTTYYAQATNGGCSSTRSSVQAVINVIPLPPTGFDDTHCGQGVVTISASSPENIYWYSTASGGSILGTGPVFTTPSISTSTTYYAEADNGCASSRVPVQAIIEALPSSPVISDVNRCGSGSVTFAASSSSLVSWYTSASGGTSVGTGLSFTTPVLSSSTTYYAEASSSTCISTRIPVQALINSTPSAPVAIDNSRCGPGVVTISATCSNTVNWYSSSSGGSIISIGLSFTSPSLNTSTTYYAEANNGCASSRVPVHAIVNSIPATPVTNNVSRCGNGSVILAATSPEQVYWYSSPSGNSLVSTGPSFTTPSLSATTNYYVEAGNNCRSIRIPVLAIINQIPSSPSVSFGTHCGTGTVSLSASSSYQINWFDVASGGNSIATGSTFNTPSLSSTTTYFAEAINAGCISPRTPVQAVILSIPSQPAVTQGVHCGSGQVLLTAAGSGQLYWYDDSIAGSVLDSGTTFTTPVIFINTNYFVEAGNGSCRSSRVPVEAVIDGAQPSSVSDGSKCGPGSLMLFAAATRPSDTLVWYDHPGGTILGTGTSFITPVLGSTTVYFVELHSSSCTGSPLPVTAYIFSLPVCNIGADTITIQSGQTIILDAGAGFNNYLWSTGESTNQIQVSAQGTYHVTVTNANGCTASDVVFVNFVNGVGQLNGKNLLRVFPNPAHDQITFELHELSGKSVLLKLISVDGKILKREEVKVSGALYTKTISLSGIARGIYFLELENENFRTTVKVIVQ